MSRCDEIRRLIERYNHRLQKLKEKKAGYGFEVPVWIEIDIEDIEAEIERLQAELKTEQVGDIEKQGVSKVFEDFKFKNREEEQVKILSSKANHIELCGPSGVGKTYLLQHIANGRENIGSVYIDLTTYNSKDEILNEVITQLTSRKSRPKNKFRSFARAIKKLYYPTKGQTSINQILFLFDSASADEEKHQEVINWLISPDGLISNESLFGFLEDLGIHRNDIKLQVVIAARRPIVKVENYHDNFRFERAQIDRLQKKPDPKEDPIQDMLRELAEHEGETLIPETCQKISDELHYLTGGHPKCAKLMLFEVARAHFLPTTDEWMSFFKKHVLPTIQIEMLNAIPDDLMFAFKALSVFRRFDQRLIATLLERGILEQRVDGPDISRQARQLRKQLTDTHLVNNPTREEPMFTMNFAVHRVLSLRMQYQLPTRYQEINQEAIEIFEDWLASQETRPDRAVISLLEIIYHHLKALEMNPEVKRETICGRIQDKLQTYLQILLDVIDEDGWSTYLPVLEDCWNSDKELQEVIEHVTGSDQCYNTLSNQIQQFIAEKTGN